MTFVVVCVPDSAYFCVQALGTHNITARADSVLGKRQHRALRDKLAACGVTVIALSELARHPNSVFVQDTAIVTPLGFIRLRMGLPSRQGEEAWMAQSLMDLGLPEVGRISAPGTVEGGDVILAGEVAFVGASRRTNAEGIRQISTILSAMGYEVRVASVPMPSLHIGGIMSMITSRYVLACEGTFEPSFFKGFDVLEVPSQGFISGNVITLGENVVLVEQHNTMTARALEQADFVVHLLDLSEFVKGTGGPSCLILPFPTCMTPHP